MASGSWFRRNFVALLAFLVALSVCSNGAFADEPVFGPVTCERGSGAPTVAEFSFAASEPFRGFIFKVFNGGLEDATYELVSSSTVILNGVEILGPANFNQSVAYLEVPIPLESQNSLRVEVRGKPGGAVTIKIDPLVVIDSPADGQAVNGQPITVSGHLNAGAASVSVNGIAAPLSGSSFSAAVSLTEGANTLVATATRADGFRGTDNVSVTLDTTPPAISVVSPPDGATVTAPAVDVAGSVDDAAAAVTVNGVAVALSGTAFSLPGLALVPGPNAILIEARDALENRSSTTVSITYAPPAPTASLVAEPAEVIQGGSATLSWSSTDAQSVSIDQGIGAVSASGSVAVNPAVTTTYTMTASGPGGTATSAVTVAVRPAGLQAQLAPSPAAIALGAATTLTWSTNAAERVVIEPGVGEVAASGTVDVSPGVTTLYRITAIGPTGVAAATALVSVLGSVAPIPEGQFGEQYQDLVPADATLAAYDQRRFSLVTGRVQGLDGAPLAGVLVGVHGRPELGTALTDAAGSYALPVEGGFGVTLTLRKEGYLPAQRQIGAGWNEIVPAETVVLLAEDLAVTTIVPDGNPGTVLVHQGTPVEDAFGRRAATLVLTGDTEVFARTEAGEVPVTAFDLRATEYVIPESMPAKLPPTTGYTYCVDLSAAGLEHVRFSRPAALWVDNFLGFAVGAVVPVGYYDFERAQWVASENGRVVALLDTNADGVTDALDASGDALPDDLDGDGSFADEVIGLGDPVRYPVGSTHWRALITHLTPWDYNWPVGCGEKHCPDPNPQGVATADDTRGVGGSCGGGGGADSTTAFNSYVENMGRVYHDDIPIPGTDLALHYNSARVPGFKTIITVPASGSAPVDSDLKRILVEVQVAGRLLQTVLPAAPNQVATLVWDGLDFRGQPVRDTLAAKVRIGFVYQAYYYLTFGAWARSFGSMGSSPTANRARMEITVWLDQEVKVTPTFRLGTIAEGWTLSGHHAIVPSDPTTLYKGDGSAITQDARSFRAFGPASGDLWVDSFCGPGGLAADGAGNLYVSDTCVHRVIRIDRSGAITTFAGRREDRYYGGGFSGDGGPATQARLRSPGALAVDAAGNVYISDRGNARVRVVDAQGIITTVAGNGQYGIGADNAPATEAPVYYGQADTAIAVDASGNLYLTEQGYPNFRIRRLGPDGLLTTVATHRPSLYNEMNGPFHLAVDGAGFVYATHNTPYGRVVKWGPDASIEIVAGGGPDETGEGIPAVQALFIQVGAIAVDGAGNLYLVDRNRGLLRVDPGGILTSVRGVWRPTALALDPEGNLYALSAELGRVYKLTTPANTQGYGSGSQWFFAEEGVGHLFSLAGRHESTIDLETKAPLVSFGYEGGRLSSVTDRHGNTTSVLRAADGTAYAIVAPQGQRTELQVLDGQLRRVLFADQSAYELAYDTGSLLTHKRDPRGSHFEHRYTPEGRVSELLDPEGGHWSWARWLDAEGDVLTSVTSAEGDVRSFSESGAWDGSYSSQETAPDGSVSSYRSTGDHASVTRTLSCGTSQTESYGVDPVWGGRFLSQLDQALPSGRARRTSVTRSYQDADADGGVDRASESVSFNGRTATRVNDTLAGVQTLSSPAGRTVTETYDTTSLLTREVSVPGLLSLSLQHGARGELTGATVGTRTTGLYYDGAGNLDYAIAPDGQRYDYTVDELGRLRAASGPDGWTVGYEYDGNGNLTVVTNPNEVSYGFEYTANNQRLVRRQPLSGGYRYHYDRDRRLETVTAPSGETITNQYLAGNLQSTTTPEGTTSYDHLCAGRLGSALRNGERVTLGYDGPLVTGDTRSGTLAASIGYGYDNDFALTSLTYAGAASALGYDSDGLLTSAGGYTIGRNAQNGLPESVSGNGLAQGRIFNGYGELDGVASSVAGGPVYAWSVSERDGAGRILRREESVAGGTILWEYAYYPGGRLREVRRDGQTVESYAYDDNGNRLSETNVLRGITGKSYGYSVEDHVLSAGSDGYVFDVDGFLQSRTGTEGTTYYQYSSRGELLRVDQPNGTILSYVHDPFGRRIAKEVNGTIVEKYLWADRTTLLAVYDGSDNLLQRYTYADGRVPVSMTAGGATYFLLTDQVGTLRAVADSTGAIVKRVDYDSFGNIIADTNPSFSVPFGFAGGLHDRDTGLVRFGYRDYSPELGRFTAKDPLDFAGGDTNLYAYAMSDPINFVDPYGLYSWDDLLQDASNYSAGFGDTLTSGFGLSDTSLTQMIREYNGTNDVVNTCSGAYGLGKSSGYAWGAATGAGLEGQTGVLFGRGYGLLNSNDFIRLGISWKGSAKAGEEVFRLAIGKKGWPIHWHLP